MKTTFRTLRSAITGSLALSAATLSWALTVPGPVVSPEWVQQNRAELTVLDIRANQKSFTAAPQFEVDKKTGRKFLAEVGGHIPGANWVDPKLMRTDRMINGLKVQFMLPEKADFEKLARGWGVPAGKPIVISTLGQDGADFNDATRLYWQFKYYGEDNIAIVNGGTTAWLAEGRTFSTEPSGPVAGNWAATAERTELLATSEDVEKASTGQSSQLVDARSSSQFLGLSKRATVAAYGRVAGAKNVSSELLVTESGDAARILPNATYANVFRQSGVDPQAATITYCNTGHLASGAWFVLSEVLGNKKTRLYDGSMHQWALEKRPMVSVNQTP